MARRARAKGRRSGSRFIGLEPRLLDHETFRTLSPRATKLFLDLASVYNGRNNGDMSIAPKITRKRGWTSQDQVYKAMHELEDAGLAIKTRQGGKNRCSLYALTIWSVDECNGKLDMGPTIAAPFWKPAKIISLVRHTDKVCPPHGQMDGQNAS